MLLHNFTEAFPLIIMAGTDYDWLCQSDHFMTGTNCGRLCQTELTLTGTGCDSFRPFRNRLLQWTYFCEESWNNRVIRNFLFFFRQLCDILPFLVTFNVKRVDSYRKSAKGGNHCRNIYTVQNGVYGLGTIIGRVPNGVLYDFERICCKIQSFWTVLWRGKASAWGIFRSGKGKKVA